MAINSVSLHIKSDVNAQPVAPCSIICDWQQVGSNGYLSLADTLHNGVILKPQTDIADESRQLIRRDNRMGTLLGLRMHHAVASNIASPTVKVFGRVVGLAASTGPWQVLKNRLGDIAVPLVARPTSDIYDLSSVGQYTVSDPEGHYFDTQGCNEFLVGVELALTGTSVTLSALEAKII